MKVVDDQQQRGPAVPALKPAQHAEEPGGAVIAGCRTGPVFPQQPMAAHVIQDLDEHAEGKGTLHRMPAAKTRAQPRRRGQATATLEQGRFPQPGLADHEQCSRPPRVHRIDKPGDGLGHTVAL